MNAQYVSNVEHCRIQHISNEWPSGLKTASEMAGMCGISAEKITNLAKCGFLPHFKVDDGAPMFKPPEVKKWLAENMLNRCTGRSLPPPICITVEAERFYDRIDIPRELQVIPNLLRFPANLAGSGIYFLARDNVLQYVGQSVNILSRISFHKNEKEFDTVYYLPWPADDLDAPEAALISILRPPLNGRTRSGSMLTPNSYDHDRVLRQLRLKLDDFDQATAA